MLCRADQRWRSEGPLAVEHLRLGDLGPGCGRKSTAGDWTELAVPDACGVPEKSLGRAERRRVGCALVGVRSTRRWDG